MLLVLVLELVPLVLLLLRLLTIRAGGTRSRAQRALRRPELGLQRGQVEGASISIRSGNGSGRRRHSAGRHDPCLFDRFFGGRSSIALAPNVNEFG